MMTIDISKFTSQDYIDFRTEASTLGLAPGEWPEELVVIDGPHTLTARFESGHYDLDGLLHVLYVDQKGHRFIVYND